MNKVTTYLWDAAEHLETKEDMAAYLEAALEDGDPNLVRSQSCRVRSLRRLLLVQRSIKFATSLMQCKQYSVPKYLD